MITHLDFLNKERVTANQPTVRAEYYLNTHSNAVSIASRTVHMVGRSVEGDTHIRTHTDTHTQTLLRRRTLVRRLQIV